ncbi:MAG TPA: hypothetical protein VIM16_00920 [Mucilaginibacter sp.]|jgi:hypothetical protein
MNQKKCNDCGAVQFYGNTEDEQCPQFCAHCNYEINPKYMELKDRPRSDGPTMMEFIDAGNKAIDYPPQGFKERPWSMVDMKRLDELNDTETKYYALINAQNEKKV